VRANVKRNLVAELREQVARAGIRPRIERVERGSARARSSTFISRAAAPRSRARAADRDRRSGEYRMLGVPGED